MSILLSPTSQRYLSRKLLLQHSPRFPDDRLNHFRGRWKVVDEADALSRSQWEVVPMIPGSRLPVDVSGEEVLPREGQDRCPRATVALNEGGAQNTRVPPGKGIRKTGGIARFLEQGLLEGGEVH